MADKRPRSRLSKGAAPASLTVGVARANIEIGKLKSTLGEGTQLKREGGDIEGYKLLRDDEQSKAIERVEASQKLPITPINRVAVTPQESSLPQTEERGIRSSENNRELAPSTLQQRWPTVRQEEPPKKELFNIDDIVQRMLEQMAFTAGDGITITGEGGRIAIGRTFDNQRNIDEIIEQVTESTPCPFGKLTPAEGSGQYTLTGGYVSGGGGHVHIGDTTVTLGSTARNIWLEVNWTASKDDDDILLSGGTMGSVSLASGTSDPPDDDQPTSTSLGGKAIIPIGYFDGERLVNFGCGNVGVMMCSNGNEGNFQHYRI